MAVWVLVTLLGLSVTANCSRVATQARQESSGGQTSEVIPEQTKEALEGWLHTKAYKYLIVAVPDLDIITKKESGNYAEFFNDLMACPGVCLAAYDFEWEIPRGHGHVPTSDAALFSYAPDETPEGLSSMGYMRLKMQLPFAMKAMTGSISNFHGKFIEVHSAEELSPDWVVPRLKGGRMGNRKDTLNPEGKALHDKLTEELKDAGLIEDDGEKPKPKPKPNTGGASEKPSKPDPIRDPHTETPIPTAPQTGFTALNHEEIRAMVQQKVEEAAERRIPEIVEAAKAAAKDAAERATSNMVTQMTKDATYRVASTAFEHASTSIEGAK